MKASNTPPALRSPPLFQGRQRNGMPPSQMPRQQKHAQLARQSGEFMQIAKSIGRDITNTYAKLEKLTLLARRKTLFDDRPQEIQGSRGKESRGRVTDKKEKTFLATPSKKRGIGTHAGRFLLSLR